MDFRFLSVAIKRFFMFLKERGLRYAINRSWFSALWNNDSIRELFLRKLYPYTVPFPPFIELETTTRCNLRCIMCEHTYWNEKCRDVNFDEFKSIVDQFRLRWIGVTGIGESFLNKDFMKMLEYIKQKDIMIEIFDTFYFVDEPTIKSLLKMGVDRIFISFDAATAETYEKIRVGSDFNRVVENIRNAFKAKKEIRDKISTIDFHFIISKLNIHEVPMYIDFVNELRQGEDVLIMFTTLLHSYDEIKELVTTVPDEIIEEAEKRARAAGISLSWNMNVTAEKPDIKYCTKWIMPFIFSTGEVIPCCVGNEANKREFQKKYSFGNVFKHSFKDIWNSEYYRQFRDKINRGETPVQCRDCSIYKTNYIGNEEQENLPKE